MNENNGLNAIRSLDYIFILCDDLNKMKRFFIDIFDFHIEEEMEGQWIVFRVGSMFLALRARGGSADGRPYDGPEIPEKSASVHISFRVPPADVDIAYEALKAKGVDIIEKPTDQDFTHRTLYFSDPENNVLEIFAEIHPRHTASASSGFHRVKVEE